MFTLKNIKINHKLSEETYCYTATLYLNGKKVAECSNHGHGGNDLYRWVSEAARDEARAAARALDPEALPGVKLGDWIVEFAVGDLLNDHVRKEDLKRMMRTKTLFRKPTETYRDGEWCTVQSKFDPKVKSFLVGKYGPEVFILNEKGV